MFLSPFQVTWWSGLIGTKNKSASQNPYFCPFDYAWVNRWSIMSNSDSELDDLIELIYMYKSLNPYQSVKQPRKKRSQVTSIVKNQTWYNDIVPLLSKSRYRYFFKVSRSHFDFILQQFMETNDEFLFKGTLSPTKKLHMYLFLCW